MYKIRREELAKGANSSVRNLARVFESNNNLNRNAPPPLLDKGKKKGFFTMRKSRSADTEAQKLNSNKVCINI